MGDIPAERKFAILCEIVRAQHFAWREAVRCMAPGVEPREAVARMWEIAGERTAESYAARIDGGRPLALQVAELVVRSSRCMGEDACAVPGRTPDEAFVRHRACPWLDWHRRLELVGEDRAGCDAWFQAMAAGIGNRLARAVQVETLEAMPDGAPSCLRRISVPHPERNRGEKR